MSKINTYFHNVIVQDFIKLVHESYQPLYRGKSSDNSFIRKAEKLAILIGHFPEKFSFDRPRGLIEWDFLIDLVNTIKHENRRGGKRELDIIGSHQFEFKENLLRFVKHELKLVNRLDNNDRVDFFKCCQGVMNYYVINNNKIIGKEFGINVTLPDFKGEVNLKQSKNELITSGAEIAFITKNEQGQNVYRDPENGFHFVFFKDPENDKHLIFNMRIGKKQTEINEE